MPFVVSLCCHSRSSSSVLTPPAFPIQLFPELPHTTLNALNPHTAHQGCINHIGMRCASMRCDILPAWESMPQRSGHQPQSPSNLFPPSIHSSHPGHGHRMTPAHSRCSSERLMEGRRRMYEHQTSRITLHYHSRCHISLPSPVSRSLLAARSASNRWPTLPYFLT